MAANELGPGGTPKLALGVKWLQESLPAGDTISAGQILKGFDRVNPPQSLTYDRCVQSDTHHTKIMQAMYAPAQK
jgi:hypothetical protein